MKKICLTLLAVVCAGFIFTGCTKDNSVINEVNNAFTKFVHAAPSDWKINSKTGSFEIAVDASDIPNKYIFNTDGVLIYVSDVNDNKGSGSYWPLPLTNHSLDGFIFDYHLENNFVIIHAIPADGSNPSNSNKPSINFYFNLIFIQPQGYSTASAVKNDYNAVKAAFHLKD